MQKIFRATSVEKQAETEEQDLVKKKVEVRMLSYVPSSPVAPNSNKADNDNEEDDEDRLSSRGPQSSLRRRSRLTSLVTSLSP